jgi:Na+-transporting NADH:ubiquinone oxidoreductase subunit NqrE
VIGFFLKMTTFDTIVRHTAGATGAGAAGTQVLNISSKKNVPNSSERRRMILWVTQQKVKQF